jgi:hypothetical protein
MIHFLTKHLNINYFKTLVAAAVFSLLTLANLQANGQGYLRDDSVTTYTSGVVLTEFTGFGNPAFDYDCNGTLTTNADEYIEWTNTSNVAINISSWRLDDGSSVGHKVAANTILGPGKKIIMFMGQTAVPSNFNAGFGNYVCATGASGNGINNSGDAIGIGNTSGRYTYIQFKTSAGSFGTINAYVTDSGSASPRTLGANSVAQVTRTTSTTALVCDGAGGLSTHATVSGLFNWSNSSVTFLNPTGSPGRHTDGYAIETPAHVNTPGITFGTTTTNTIPVTALTNSQIGHRRIIVVKQGSAVSFTPTDSVTYSGVNANFSSASDQGSGNKIVMDDTLTVNSVTVSGLSPSTTYHFAIYEYNGNTPSRDRNYRTASSVAIGNTSTAAPLNPTVNVSVSASTGTEAASTVITVTATASAAVGADETVSVGVSGTGITAGDYTLSNTTLTILSGNTTGTVTFTVNNDSIGEGTETATIAISSPSSGLTLGTTLQQTVTITDNEPSITLSYSANPTTEGTTISIFATLSDTILTSTQTATLSFSGTGVAAADYTLDKTVFSFEPAELTDTIVLTIVDDVVRESQEIFAPSLTALSARIWKGSTPSLTVNDNDDTHSITALNSALPVDSFDQAIVIPGTQMYKGWYFLENGTNANTGYDTTMGNTTTGNTLSCGSAGSTDRALGCLTTGSLTPVYIGAKYTNNTGSNINALIISYVGEMWRNQGTADKLDFQYSTNATNVGDNVATWTDVNSLDFNTPATATAILNGNQVGNKVNLNNIAFQLTSDVANGNSFWIRFVDVDVAGSDAIMAVDSFVLTAKSVNVTKYYNKTSGSLHLTSSWSDLPNGSGASPANFTDDAQYFVVQNNATITADWTVTGVGSKVIVGDSINAVTFTIPSTSSYTGTADVKNLGVLKLQNTNIPALGVLDTNSTVEYNQATATNINIGYNYGNLTVSGSATITFPAGTTNVIGNLSYSNATIDFAVSPTTLNLGGNINVTGTLTTIDSTRSYGIITVGNGNQTFSGNGNVLYIFRLTSTKTAGSLALSNITLRAREDYRLSFSGSATFNDGGTNIYCADDFQTDGTSSAYTLTGTVTMNATTGTGNIEQNTSGGLVIAKLNNLTWALTGSAAGNFSGSGGFIYINGNFSIASNAVGAVALGSSTFEIKGNFVNDRNADLITENTSKVLFNGTSAQSITSAFTTGETFRKLVLANTSGLTINRNLTVSDSLILTDGIITSNNNYVISTGTASRTNGWVNGRLRKSLSSGSNVAVTYLVGDAANYLPVDLNFASITTGGSASASAHTAPALGTLYNNVCIDTNKTIDRVWLMDATGGLVFTTYTGTFRFLAADTTSGAITNLNNCIVQVYDGSNNENETVSGHTTTSISISGATKVGIVYAGEMRNLTSTFSVGSANTCINNPVTITYTGTGNGSGTYTWSFDGGSIISGSGKGPYNISWNTTGAKNLTLQVAEGGCSTGTSTGGITVFSSGWTGAVDTLWSKAANWCSGSVPNSTTDVFIPAGLTNYPTIGSGATCRDLNIVSGGSLKMYNGANLTINGDFTLGGNLLAAGGTTTFNKTNGTVPAATYHILKIDGTGSYTLGGNVTTNNNFFINNASTTLNTAGFTLTVKGDPTINGSIAGNGKMNLSRAAGYITLSGNGSASNVVVNTSTAGGVRNAGNFTIGDSLTINLGTWLINNNTTLTLGSASASTGVYTDNGGLGIIGSAASTNATLSIQGNAAAPTLSGLKFTVAKFILNRPNGIKLGATSTIYSTITLSNGRLNLFGNTLNAGATNTAVTITTTGGKFSNTLTTGSLVIGGNASSPAIGSLNIDSMATLNFNYPSGALLNTNMFVSGQVKFYSGKIDLNGNVVTLGSSGSLSEGAGTLFTGNSGAITTTRTISTSITNNNIAGMGLQVTTNTAPGVTTIRRGHTQFTTTGSSIRRYYGFNPANDTGMVATLLINYDSSELAGANRGFLRMSKSVNNGTNWTTLTGGARTTVVAATGYATRTGITVPDAGAWFTLSDSVNTPLVKNMGMSTLATPSKASAFSVYPNPFNNQLNIRNNGTSGKIYQIQLVDLSGKMIASQQIVTNGLDMSIALPEMPAGIYFVRMINSQDQQIFKVVKE